MTLRLSLKFIFPLFIFLIFGCKKDKSVLGVDEQPSSDNLDADHISGKPITAFSVPYDSVASFNYAYKYLGSNNDPNFGMTDVGLYFSTSIDRALNFGVNSRIDSAEIVLALDITDFVGDKNAVLNYSIFPVTSTLDPLKAYFTGDTRRHSTTPICTGLVSTSTVTGVPLFRLKLDSTYAEKLLHDTVNLVTNEKYQAAYPGYYIATSIQGSGEGVIVSANLDNILSGVFVHYKTAPLTATTVTNWRFAISGASVLRYNTIKYAPKAEVKNQFMDSTLGSSYLYAKGMGMSKIKLQIPFLQNYSDTFKVAVNRAEIMFYVDRPFTASGNYPEPPKLLLLSIDSLGRETYVKDLLSITDNSRYDGTYDATNNRYVFNIAREAQQILDGQKKNRGFYLVVANTDLSLITTYYSDKSKILAPLRRDNYIKGIVLAGQGNALKKPVFNLSYVRFKND